MKQKKSQTLFLIFLFFTFLTILLLFITPIIDMTYLTHPVGEIWPLPNGKLIYVWGRWVELEIADIINSGNATDFNFFPKEAPYLFFSGLVLYLISLLQLSFVIDVNSKFKLISIIITPLISGLSIIACMIRYIIFGIQISDSLINFKFACGLYSGILLGLLLIVESIILIVKPDIFLIRKIFLNISENTDLNSREEN